MRPISINLDPKPFTDGFATVVGDAFGARLAIEHADGAEREAFLGFQQGASIKAKPACCGDQRIADESIVQKSVGNDHGVALQDGVDADRDVERKFTSPDSDFCLEPLPAICNQVHDRDRRAKSVRGQPHDIVEIRLPWRIEDSVTLEGGEPVPFVPLPPCVYPLGGVNVVHILASCQTHQISAFNNK